MLICLDAGHGLHTPGKRCLKTIDPKETREWVLNSRIAEKTQTLLAAYDCGVMRVDDPEGEEDIPLARRVQMANEAKADAFVSIHHNAGVKGGAGGGIVVFAARKAGETALRLQRAVYEQTVARTGLKGNRADPLPRKDFYVLRSTKMPAVLGEFGFMDSTTDTPVILTEEFAGEAAAGITAALAEVFGLEKTDKDYETWKRYMERYRRELGALPAAMPDHVAEAVALGITTGERPMGLADREEVMTMVKNAVVGR